jgi:hypothetical protein
MKFGCTDIGYIYVDNFYFVLIALLLVLVSFFISFGQCKFEIYFSWYKYCYSCPFLVAIDLVNLLPTFYSKPCLFLSIRWISCKLQSVVSSFFIQFAKWCLLMGKMNPLILMGKWWFLLFSCFCCLRIWLCAAESMLLSDYLWFILSSGTSCPLVVLFAFIFCVQNSL